MELHKCCRSQSSPIQTVVWVAGKKNVRWVPLLLVYYYKKLCQLLKVCEPLIKRKSVAGVDVLIILSLCLLAPYRWKHYSDLKKNSHPSCPQRLVWTQLLFGDIVDLFVPKGLLWLCKRCDSEPPTAARVLWHLLLGYLPGSFVMAQEPFWAEMIGNPYCVLLFHILLCLWNGHCNSTCAQCDFLLFQDFEKHFSPCSAYPRFPVRREFFIWYKEGRE